MGVLIVLVVVVFLVALIFWFGFFDCGFLMVDVTGSVPFGFQFFCLF